MCTQLLTTEDYVDDEQLEFDTSENVWKACSAAHAEHVKLNGLKFPSKRKKFAQWGMPKRRRTKAFQAVMQLNNMLRKSCDIGLSKFKFPETDPFEGYHLSLCPDMGADMVAMWHFLAYKCNLNITADWDLDHGASNAGKQALKHSGLWPTCVIMAAANNCVYGSTLSPARLQAVRECVQNWFESVNPADNSIFLRLLPRIVKCFQRAGVVIEKTDPDVVQVSGYETRTKSDDSFHECHVCIHVASMLGSHMSIPCLCSCACPFACRQHILVRMHVHSCSTISISMFMLRYMRSFCSCIRCWSSHVERAGWLADPAGGLVACQAVPLLVMGVVLAMEPPAIATRVVLSLTVSPTCVFREGR